MKIAIIGAGLAGLTLARKLQAHHSVTVLEKARGPGGRMSTRRAAPYAFDHGAQYFTAQTEAFQHFIEDMKSLDLIAPWPGDIALIGGAHVSEKPKYVATPSMNAICKHLAQDVDVQTQTHAETLKRTQESWVIEDKNGASYGPFDWVISSAPSVQTAALFPDRFLYQKTLENVQMSGCFSLMLGFETPLDLPWAALKSGRPPVGWMAVNSNKPHRPTSYAILIQSTNAWAEVHLEDDPDTVMQALLNAASEIAGADLAAASHRVLHRWRYAATSQPAGLPFLMDEDQALAACGDWCLGSKVEAAFSSASALADALLSLPKT
ncbi:MAG: FAD-dependent oxidoreductase [Pseudomonadota bacterium]